MIDLVNINDIPNFNRKLLVFPLFCPKMFINFGSPQLSN